MLWHSKITPCSQSTLSSLQEFQGQNSLNSFKFIIAVRSSQSEGPKRTACCLAKVSSWSRNVEAVNLGCGTFVSLNYCSNSWEAAPESPHFSGFAASDSNAGSSSRATSLAGFAMFCWKDTVDLAFERFEFEVWVSRLKLFFKAHMFKFKFHVQHLKIHISELKSNVFEVRFHAWSLNFSVYILSFKFKT